MKKYVITESQYNELIEKKRKETKIVDQILEDIEKAKNSLNEGEMLNEAIVDTIKKYLKKGLLTTAIIASLLANNVQAQTLAQAGVSPAKIEQAQNQDQSGKITPDRVEKKLLNILKKRGQDGIINQYNSLGMGEKSQLLSTITKSITKLSDIDQFEYRITDWMSKQMQDSRYSQINQQEKITVDTITVNLVKDFIGSFTVNSSEIQNAEQTKKELQDIFNSFDEIQNVTIVSSSSTLRNTGDAEGKTWMQLSTERAESLSGIINGMTYNLGGEGVNQTHTINGNQIKLDVDGTNGDGTSGPRSSYEANPEVVAYYQQKGIDPSLWKSTATQEPYANKADYNQHQYVKVIITGNVVESDTDQIVNYKYLVMKEKQEDFKIEKSKHQNNKIDKKGVIACPIKINS